MRNLVSWFVPAVVFAACSSSGGGSSATADQASGDLAKALCQKFDSCSAFYVKLQFGDVSACEAAGKVSAVNVLAATGTGETPSLAESCAAAIAAASCDDLLAHNLPGACQSPAGHLANGAACGDSSQCQSAFCHKPSTSTCGACAAPPAVGATCAIDDDCPTGDVCTKALTCAPAGGSGASCDPFQHPCKPTLACKNKTCAAPDKAGASCTKTIGTSGTADTCDALAGLFCNGPGTTGTCVEVGLANAGMPCFLVNNGLTLCAANGACNLSAPATAGACMAAAAPGGTCQRSAAPFGVSLTAPDCALPAKCENGICTLPNPSTCH